MIKGTPLHEIMHLPFYWQKVLQVKRAAFDESKIAFGPHPHQYFLLLKPAGSEIPKGLMMYFHGGGWRFGHPKMFRANAQLFLEEGFWVVLPTYRRIPFFNYLHMREDISLAFKKVLELVKSKKMEGLPLLVGGMSAGGNLAAHLFYNENELNKIGSTQSEISGLFLCGAPLDLALMRPSVVLQRFAGARDGTLFKLANPVNYLPPAHQAPTLIIQGNNDGLVEYQGAVAFVEKLEYYQKSGVDFHLLDGATHLDTVRWVYEEGRERTLIKNWLKNFKL